MHLQRSSSIAQRTPLCKGAQRRGHAATRAAANNCQGGPAMVADCAVCVKMLENDSPCSSLIASARR